MTDTKKFLAWFIPASVLWICFLSVCFAGFDHELPNDKVIQGSGAGTDKVYEFQHGDGALNPKITVPTATKDFRLSDDLFVTGQGDFTGAGNFGTTLGVVGNITQGGNTFTLGDGTVTNQTIISDQGLGGSNPFMQYDAVLGKWTVSNDGVSIIKIGSGSGGGGLNFFATDDNDKNFQFEDNVGDWTGVGVSPVHETGAADVLQGAGSLSWDATATGQTLRHDLLSIPNQFKGRECAVGFNYKWEGSAGDLFVEVLDDLSNVLRVLDLEPTAVGGASKDFAMGFVCPGTPASPRSVQISIESTADAAKLFMDEAFNGEQKFIQFATAEIAGQSAIDNNTNCSWSLNSATFADFPTDADCLGPTIIDESVGSWQTTDADLPQQTINNLPAGKYIMEVITRLSGNTASVQTAIRVSDGTTNGPECGSAHASGSGVSVTCRGIFVYTATGDRTFKIQGATSGTAIQLNYSSPQSGQVIFTLYKFPTSAQKSLPFHAADTFIDVNIGGATLTLPASAQTTYGELTNAGLDMVLNRGSAQIPCSATNPSTGLTCSSGSESLGIVFNADSEGDYRVCGTVSVEWASVGERLTLQWIETPNNAQTILALGNDRKQLGNAGIADNSDSLDVCGNFTFASAGQKTLRLMHQRSGSGSGMSLRMDRAGAGEGDRDMHITVEKIGAVVRSVTFPELNFTDGANSPVNNFRVFIDNFGGAGLIDSQLGDSVQSLSSPGTGQIVLTLKSGACSATPFCTCTSGRDTGFNVDIKCNLADTDNWTSSTIKFITENNAAAGSEADMHISCGCLK